MTPLLAAEVARVVEEQVYEREVFLVRSLGFVTPTAAHQLRGFAGLSSRCTRGAYLEHGFHLVDVPAGVVDERAVPTSKAT